MYFRTQSHAPAETEDPRDAKHLAPCRAGTSRVDRVRPLSRAPPRFERRARQYERRQTLRPRLLPCTASPLPWTRLTQGTHHKVPTHPTGLVITITRGGTRLVCACCVTCPGCNPQIVQSARPLGCGPRGYLRADHRARFLATGQRSRPSCLQAVAGLRNAAPAHVAAIVHKRAVARTMPRFCGGRPIREPTNRRCVAHPATRRFEISRPMAWKV